MPVYQVLEKQVGWYEASLPSQERRSRGHFSTPPLLVERMLDACGYIPNSDLRSIRVLDPACGSGNFLTAAARRLTSSAINTNVPPRELASLIQRNIWGFDPDPVSCFLAEMQLSAAVTNAINTISQTNHTNTPPWHLHQADALTLPWQEPCIDLFLANPPYLAAKNTDLSAYRSTHQHGQADSYLLFLNLGLQIVRSCGWLALVLPDPLLARANASNERARLLKAFTIHHLWHLAGVFTAQVGAVVIIAQKNPPHSQHHVAWKRERWKPSIPSSHSSPDPTISQTIFQRQPRSELRYLLGASQATLIERLQTCLSETPASPSHFAPLDTFVSICRGEELGRKNPSLIHQSTLYPTEPPPYVHSRGDALCSPADPSPSNPTIPPSNSRGNENPYHQQYYPILRGGKDTRPYITPSADWWIAREAIAKPLERYLSPKLLVVKSTDRLQATLDLEGHVALQTLYILHPREQNAREDDLYFFLALLNSRLLRHYVYVLHTAYKWVQPQIEQRVLARLPIPVVTTSAKKDIIERAKLLACACSAQGPVVEWKTDIQNMYEELERAISALYHAIIC